MAALQRERLDAGIEVLRLDRPHTRGALDSAALAKHEAALVEWRRTAPVCPTEDCERSHADTA